MNELDSLLKRCPAMVNGVLWLSGRIAGFICTAHTEQHIEQLVRAARIAIESAYCGPIETSSPAPPPTPTEGNSRSDRGPN